MANEKKPNRIGKFFRDYKSELKKITWCPFKTVKQSTVLVIVLTIILAAIIAVLDLGFSKGLVEFGKLISIG
ncbi:MAG: preprotein translocase subunit SecE [Clostridia bacterium]|nr:preprotein translocase subunit SecE [Clostridia bacterium]